MLKSLVKVLFLCTSTFAFAPSQATIVRFGDLQSDTDSNTILDINSGRQYLRFDTFNLSVADTLQAVTMGGLYEGWTVVTSDISDNFINALFSQNGTNVCGIGENISGELCGRDPNWFDGAFGQSFNTQFDFFAFLSTQTSDLPDVEIGLIQIDTFGSFQKFDDWGERNNLDEFGITSRPNTPINLLLYKDALSIDAPGSFTIFSLVVLVICMRKSMYATGS